MGENDSLQITFITQWFPPEPITVPQWIVSALQKNGFSIEVITAQPNYPSGIIYDGFSGWKFTKAEVDGTEITRVPTYANHDSSSIKRVLNYLTFGFSSSIFGLKAVSRTDVVLVYFSPPTAALAALIGRLVMRKPYILYLQDLWPESLTATGMLPKSFANNRVFSALMNWSLNVMYKYSDSIAVISPGMKTRLIEHGQAPKKIAVIANWADEDLYRPQESTGELRARMGIPDNQVVLGYFGNHGKAQALDCWLEAIAKIEPSRRPWVLFVGEGTEKDQLKASAHRLELSKCLFLDSVPATEIPAIAAECDALIVSLAADPLFSITIPGKVQSCLALAKPVLATLSGDAAEVITSANSGFVAFPEDPDAVCRIIENFEALSKSEQISLGQRGREYYMTHMSSASGSQKFAALFRKTRGKHSR